MPALKNQHFVPRCHMRPFTLGGEGLAINLFNFARRRAVPKAPVKSQCSADYFYGKDLHYEKHLQFFEGMYSEGVKRISAPGYALASGDREFFLSFWVIQHLRTEAASRAFAAISNEMVDTTCAPEDYRMSIEQCVQIAMGIVPEMVEAVSDLKVCLLRNRSKVDFFTSDDPAVYTNRWFLRPGHERLGAPGLSNSGTLCLLPLTPRHFFLAYDGDVYSLPVANGWVEVRRDIDARMLNEQLMLTAIENVYFHEIGDAEAIADAFDEVSARRLPSRHRLNHAVLEQVDGQSKLFRQTSAEEAREHGQAMIHSERLYPRPRGWPDFIRWRVGAVTYSNGTGLGYLRRAHADSTWTRPFRKVRLDTIRF